MSLTLEDIAQLSSVSRSTVSRVINGDANVREETRRRVLEVIQRNNYQPNLAARQLAAGHTKVIGLVIPAGVGTIFSDPYFAQFTQGLSDACSEKEYSIMLWLASPEYERRMIRRILGSSLVDGIVVLSTLVDDPLVSALHESQMPFILIGSHPSLEVNSVDVDNIEGARLATRHLLSTSPSKIATITGPQNMMVGRERYQGFAQAVTENGRKLEDTLAVEGDFTEMGGYTAMKSLLAAQPQAVFAASDLMATGAMRAIREAGLRIPADIAIAGHDDMPIASQTNPALTTVRQPLGQMGLLTIETLIELIHHPGQPTRRIVLKPELIIRASCGSSPAN
jgi:LacI family transcriptional regulator